MRVYVGRDANGKRKYRLARREGRHRTQRVLIRILPAHHPTQITPLAAFTRNDLVPEVAAAFSSAAVGLIAAGVLYRLRVRVRR